MVKVRRKGGWRASSLLAVLAVMVFLQGCAGGGMSGAVSADGRACSTATVGRLRSWKWWVQSWLRK